MSKRESGLGSENRLGKAASVLADAALSPPATKRSAIERPLGGMPLAW